MRLLFDFVIIFHGTFEACADVTLCSSCGKSEICINIWLKRSAAPGYTDLDFHALLHLKTFKKKNLSVPTNLSAEELRHLNSVFATAASVNFN